MYAVEESSGSVVFRLPNESSSVSARDANALAGFRIVAQKCLTVVSVLGNNPELSTVRERERVKVIEKESQSVCQSDRESQSDRERESK